MKWNNVRKLHLEISGKCNAACPMCARYPTASHYVHPNIEDDFMWTLETVKLRLPSESLANITMILLNGTIGDFITNPEGLEIVEYFRQSAPSASIMINTNGSARNASWWKRLATIPKVTVNFAIDGLIDTHHLYRRNTNWQKIIDNATTYIQAGGRAEWTMVIFDHNKHQVDQCRQLSKTLGFKSFLARNSDRVNTIARDRDGNPEYEIKSANEKIVRIYTAKELVDKEFKLKSKTFTAGQQETTEAFPNTSYCESLSDNSIYIGSDWSVLPCCFYGAVSINREIDHRYKNFKSALDAEQLTFDDLKATDEQSVIDRVNRGFDWIYSRLETEKALVTCYGSCHPKDAMYHQSWDSSTRTNFNGGKAWPPARK